MYETKIKLIRASLLVVMWALGFCTGYFHQQGRLEQLEERLAVAEEQQQEAARNIGEAKGRVTDAQETTGRLEDGVNESRRIEQSSETILNRIQTLINKVEAENA